MSSHQSLYLTDHFPIPAGSVFLYDAYDGPWLFWLAREVMSETDPVVGRWSSDLGHSWSRSKTIQLVHLLKFRQVKLDGDQQEVWNAATNISVRGSFPDHKTNCDCQLCFLSRAASLEKDLPRLEKLEAAADRRPVPRAVK
jgi:hypothetical protein